ncbi:eCIS core domain-containing protein [Kordia aestuariivivens]|nr:DUF4157 domain-containing protein [Kordia aestuariivivens]
MQQQTASSVFQFEDNRPESVAQLKMKERLEATNSSNPIQQKKNDTGLPDKLKSGIENLSGHSMDDVKVHYNSSKPVQLNAHAYAQGSNIHIASGQEKHLPHEAWHVVQQKQGRVKPTKQLKQKVNINDDVGLEKEADVMGAKAMQLKAQENVSVHKNAYKSSTAQLEGNKVKKTVQYGLGSLLVGAAFGLLINSQPEFYGQALASAAAVFLPTFLGAVTGFMKGKKQDDDDAAEWASLQPILKTFPNNQPQALEDEVETYKAQVAFDEGLSFLVSYRNKRGFERALNSGQKFIWVYKTDKDLRIGSPENNQHSVVGGGQPVYSAGEGVKPSKAGKIADLRGTINVLELKVRKASDGRGTYEGMLMENKAKLEQELKKITRQQQAASDVVHINLRSGHYAPIIDMDRWQISVYAWKQAGYKAQRMPGGSFLPKQDAHGGEEEKSAEHKKNK